MVHASEKKPNIAGWQLGVMRAAWLLVAVLGGVLFLGGLPAEYRAHLQVAQGLYHPALASLGLTEGFFAAYRTLLDLVLVSAFFFVGVAVFSRKRDDPMVFLVSLTCTSFGMLFTPTLYMLSAEQASFRFLVGLVRSVALVCILLVFYLLPDGKFTPRITRALAAGWLILVILWLLFPNLPFNLIYIDTWWHNLAASFTLYLAWYLTGVAAQVYRFRKVSTPIQRQQTKWLVYGLAGGVAGFLLYNLPLIISPVISQPGIPNLIYILVGSPLYDITILLAPLCLAISILRFRLWDIDHLINRSLVYGVLTVTILALYFGFVLVLQQLIRTFTASTSPVANAVSTLAIAALFNPLRDQVQYAIDRRFYRRKYDAAKALEAYARSLREEVDLDRMSERLVLLVEETMQPEHVELWLRKVE